MGGRAIGAPSSVPGGGRVEPAGDLPPRLSFPLCGAWEPHQVSRELGLGNPIVGLWTCLLAILAFR